MHRTVILMLAVLAFVANTVRANPLVALASGAETQNVSQQWGLIKDSLQTNKESLCSFLLHGMDASDETLDLKSVTELFERSLEHLAKASEYVAKIRPFVEEQVIRNFDLSGGQYVLDISNSRRDLIDQYEQAERNNSSEQFKQGLLDKYFYKACSSKLGTVLAEKSMYDSLLKIEKQLKSKFAL